MKFFILNKYDVFLQFSKTASSIITQFLLAPIFLYFWNIEDYAVWITLITIPNILIIGNNSLISYANNLIIINFNKKNLNQARKIFNNSFFLSFLLCFILIFFFLILNYLFNFKNIFKINSLSLIEINIVIIFLMSKLFLDLLTKLNLVFFKADNKLNFVNIYQLTFILIEFILIVIFLFFGSNIIEISFVSMMTQLFGFLISFKISNNYKNYFSYSVLNLEFNEIIKIILPSISFMAPTINRIILVHGSILFISLNFNYKILVLFNLLRLMLTGLKYLITALSNVYENQILIFLGKSQYNSIITYYLNFLKITLIISIVNLIIFYLIGEQVFILWTGKSEIWISGFYNLFLIAFFFEWISTAFQTLPYAINKPFLLNKIYLTNIFIYFIVLFFLKKYFNYQIVPIALICANLFFLFFSGILAFRLIKKLK